MTSNQLNEGNSDLQITPVASTTINIDDVQQIVIVPVACKFEDGPKSQIRNYFFAQSFDHFGLRNSMALFPADGLSGESIKGHPSTIIDFETKNLDPMPISLVHDYKRLESEKSNQDKKAKIEKNVRGAEGTQQKRSYKRKNSKSTPDVSEPIQQPIDGSDVTGIKMNSEIVMDQTFESKAANGKMPNGGETVSKTSVATKRPRKQILSGRAKLAAKPRVRKTMKKLKPLLAPIRQSEPRTESFQEKFGSWNPEDDMIDFDEIRLNLIEAGDELGYVNPNRSHDIFAPVPWDVERDEQGMAIDPNEPPASQGQFDVPFPEPHQARGVMKNFPDKEDYDPYTFVSVPLDEISPMSLHRIF